MQIKPLDTNALPKPLPLKKLLGPSFILLGLGLGSGEIILWPYLTSHYGMGIIWGAVLGITFQFVINMEVERYALVRGESIFMGFARKWKNMPLWFLLSTFVPWVWPGIIASSAKFLGYVVGIQQTQFLAIALLILIGVILSLGPVLYKTVEGFQKTLILISIPTIFLITVALAGQVHWVALAKGLIGQGAGYWFLPAGIPIASFLAALAYAGAGGNLNLAQSYYIKEKGYGMGKYAGKLTSIFTGKQENIELTGSTFAITPESLANFKKWWENINLEHALVFWLTGIITITMLAFLAYITTHYLSVKPEGINFVILESTEIGRLLPALPLVGVLFLLIAAATLFGTQLTVFDATSRIISENVVISPGSRLQGKSVAKVYYFVVWAQILAGILIFLLGITEPLQLLTIAAVLNAFAMFIHTGITLWLNTTSLEKELRPTRIRRLAMAAALLFYGGFSIYTAVIIFL